MSVTSVCNNITSVCNSVTLVFNSVTSMYNSVTSSHFNRCRHFALASKECYAPRLRMMVTCVDKQRCCNFYGMVQCYGQTLYIAFMLHSNFLCLVTLLQMALVTQCSLQRCYITLLCYMSVPTVMQHHHKQCHVISAVCEEVTRYKNYCAI